MNKKNTIYFSDTKPHFEVLDGLRGVAAIMVVIFHVFEAFSGWNHSKQIINHGYLAVDFFFLLSGYVIGYSYDDRWPKITIVDFFKRRLIRLHPMIIMGTLIGAICFYFGASPDCFPLIANTPVLKMIGIMLIGFTLIPITIGMDIRGWQEMHPLDGPAWSLFFEYLGNILYALIIRKLPNFILFLFTIAAAFLVVRLAVNQGDVIGGWSLNKAQLSVGFTRLLFPFFAGLLLSRITKPSNLKNSFLWCSVLIVIVLSVPRIGTDAHLWQNGLYDSLIVICVFPVIVYLGASKSYVNERTSKICRNLGNISYPLYITHYPFIYIFTAWVINNKMTFQNAWHMSLLVVVLSILIAIICFKFYDLPLRKFLTKKIIHNNIN